MEGFMKLFQKITVVVFVGLITISCSKNTEREISFILKGMSNPYWQIMKKGIQDTAKKHNVKVAVYGSQSDQDAQAQLDICEIALQKNPKAIVFAGVNSSNLLPCLKKASDKNIKLVDIDGSIEKKFVKENNLNVLFSVGSDNYELGKKAAEYVNSRRVEGKALILEGVAGSYQSNLRRNGFVENVNSNIEVAAKFSADWESIKAANITNDVITKYPDLRVVFAANDMMAIGAAELLKSKNIHDVTIIGIDGVADAIKAIKENRISASIAQLPYLMGKVTLEKIINYNEDENIKFVQHVPVLTLSNEVLNSNNPLLEYVK
jgi:ribose transport system substrate-binding protein/D-allose transport system substrate-binding protein